MRRSSLRSSKRQRLVDLYSTNKLTVSFSLSSSLLFSLSPLIQSAKLKQSVQVLARNKKFKKKSNEKTSVSSSVSVVSPHDPVSRSVCKGGRGDFSSWLDVDVCNVFFYFL